MKKNLFSLLLILFSGKTFAQNCQEVQKLFKVQDTTVLYSDKVVKFRISATDFPPLYRYPETRQLQDAIKSAQSHIEKAAQSIVNKEYNQAKYSLKQADYQIQDAEFACSELSFILWKREIKFHQSAISAIEAARANKDTTKAIAVKNNSNQALTKADSIHLAARQEAENRGYTVDYSYYGGKEKAEAYMKSVRFGSVAVGSGSSYSSSTSTRSSAKSSRTQYVTSHSRHTKSGKTVSVKSYHRSPRGYSSSHSYRSRRK